MPAINSSPQPRTPSLSGLNIKRYLTQMARKISGEQQTDCGMKYSESTRPVTGRHRWMDG